MTLACRLSSYLVGASLLLVASGCSTTLVQYLPAGDQTTCDAAWPGLWKAAAPADKTSAADKPDYVWVEISADCKQFTFTDVEKTSTDLKRLSLVTTEGDDYLSISDGDGKPECIGDNNTDCGLPLVRYVRDGDEIRLYSANHARVSAAIANEGVTGVTRVPPTPDPNKPTPQMVAKPDFRNLLTGSPEQIAQLLAEHPDFFETTPWLVLHRDTHDTRPKHPAKNR